MPSADAFELSLEKAQAIADKFDLNLPSSVTVFSDGMVNDVFSLDDKYVVKVNTGNPELPKLKKEAELYARFNEWEIPAPEVFGYDDSREILEYKYVVMEQLSGSPLKDGWGEMDVSTQQNWLEKLGQLLGKVHSIHFSEFGEDIKDGNFKGEKSLKDYLRKYVGGILEKLREVDVLEEEKVKCIEYFYFNNELFDVDINSSLLHGNFIPANVIVQNNQIQGVIDWEWSRAAHNEEELATFLYREINMEKEKMSSFLFGYDAIYPVSEEFQERLYAYTLLYYLRVLPHVPEWTHRPDKQEEYFEEVDKLYDKVIL